MMRLLHLGLRWWDRHHLSERLRALAVFLPGVLLVVVIHVLFLQLDQGRDLVRLTLEHPLRRGVLGLAVIALAYVSWYGARVVAFLRWARTGRHPRIRSVLPRLIGHGTYMAALVAVVRAGNGLQQWTCECPVILTVSLDAVWFVVLTRLCHALRVRVRARLIGAVRGDRAAVPRKLARLRVQLHALLFIGPLVLVVSGQDTRLQLPGLPWLVPVAMLVLMQSAFGVLVNLRSQWLPVIHPRVPRPGAPWPFLFPGREEEHRPQHHDMLPYDHELSHFRRFNLIATGLLAAHLLLWAFPAAAPAVGGLGIAWAGFALITGLVNLLRVLGRRTGLPIGLGLLGLVLLMGAVRDHHAVHLHTEKAPVRDERPDIAQALSNWYRRQPQGRKGPLPMVFVLADGGASRSGHWVLRVLDTLGRAEPCFPVKLFALSGTSGGAVGLAAYHLDLRLADANGSMGTTHSSLRADLLSPTLAHLLGPDLLNLGGGLWPDRARALEQALERADSAWGRPVRAVFNRYADTLPLLFLNTTRVHDGLPGVIASMRLCGDSDAVSRRTDLLAQRFAGDADLAFSTAAILSARFPYMSPAGGLYFNGRWNHYVDGGYFDNSGAGIVTEILRHIATLRMNSPDTAWIQRVRPVVLHISNTAPDRPDGGEGRLHTLANDLAAPLLTVLGTYTAQTGINDERLRAELRHSFRCDTCYVDINLYEQAADMDFTMSWSMSRQMQDSLDALARRHPKVTTALRRMRSAP
ncbi:MAG: patatin-like phospholipase family protein [Flavobacteriales bacterium]|nr:patatin-like phospholipase family protein [Flavobacteriales bacterium]